jgi:hypothetical protein
LQPDTNGRIAPQVRPNEPAEVAAPRAFDAHRHHGRTGTGRDEARSVVDLHERSGRGQPSFRKYHHGRAGLDEPYDEFDGQRTGRVDHEVRYEPKHPAEERALRDLSVHHERRVDGQERGEQQAVQERLMIGDDQRPVVVEFSGLPVEPHPKQQFEDRSKHRFEEAPAGSGSAHKWPVAPLRYGKRTPP